MNHSDPSQFAAEARAELERSPQLCPDLLDTYPRDTDKGERHLLEWIRRVGMAVACESSSDSDAKRLCGKVIGFYTGRPLRNWQEITWAVDLGARMPVLSIPLLRTVVVSVRLGIRGEVPVLANLAQWGDKTDELLPRFKNSFLRRRHF